MGDYNMNYKKGLLAFCLAMCLLLAVSSVAASEASDAAIAGEDQSDNLLEIENQAAFGEAAGDVDEKISSSGDEILAEQDNGTFKALQDKIDNAFEGSTIILENDYAYEDYTPSIKITKALTIDGNNHVIDADSKRIFLLTGDNIVLKNIVFKNGWCTGWEDCNFSGGPIYNIGANLTISSCSFTDCSAGDYLGGAIINEGAGCTIDSCNFTGCRADEGGAIFNYGVNFRISSCSFTKCSVHNDGGAIDTRASNCTIDSCIFTDCEGFNGGSIFNKGNTCSVSYCSFVNSKAGNRAGAIYNSKGNTYTLISHCTFTNCICTRGNGVIYNYENENPIVSSEFINCSSVVIFNKQCTTSATDCNFTNKNEAEVGSNIEFINCTFAVASNDIPVVNDTVVENDTAVSNDTGNAAENATDSNATTITVEPKIVASNANVVYSAGSYYTITVYGTGGKLANGANVKVTGKITNSLITTNGIAKFQVSQAPGNYKITISALGKSVSRTITVKHLVTLKTATVKKSAKKLVLQATLGKINGKYLKNKKITFKFNGKKYTTKTNKKGVAKVTVKSSVLKKLKVGKKVTYQATYLKDTVKKSVKVKK